MNPDNLVEALRAAVPLNILLMRDWPERLRLNEAHWAARVVSAKGDVLQFGGSRPGQAAGALNALAKGLAAAAYQPGGVTFAGLHWCTEEHAECPGAQPGAARGAA